VLIRDLDICFLTSVRIIDNKAFLPEEGGPLDRNGSTGGIDRSRSLRDHGGVGDDIRLKLPIERDIQ
jgi:hypothetical protein